MTANIESKFNCLLRIGWGIFIGNAKPRFLSRITQGQGKDQDQADRNLLLLGIDMEQLIFVFGSPVKYHRCIDLHLVM